MFCAVLFLEARRRPDPRNDAKIRGLVVLVAVEEAQKHTRPKDSLQPFLKDKKEVIVSGGDSEFPS